MMMANIPPFGAAMKIVRNDANQQYNEERFDTIFKAMDGGEFLSRYITRRKSMSMKNRNILAPLVAIFIVWTIYADSININFTDGTALNTTNSLGLTGYAVSGDLWDNIIGNNGTLSTVHLTTADGQKSTITNSTVTISGTRGHWGCDQLDAKVELRRGYIDDNSSNISPTVTISGIPFDRYRVIVYHATDSEHLKFGYDTINGIDYSGVSGMTAHGTLPWGDSGDLKSADPIKEGKNTLVSGIFVNNAQKTATITAHGRPYNSTSSHMDIRSGIAAIQIVDATDEIVDCSGLLSRFIDYGDDNGAWNFPEDAYLTSFNTNCSGIAIGTNGIFFAMSSAQNKVTASVLAEIPPGAQGSLIGFKIGSSNNVRALYMGDGSFLITYNNIDEFSQSELVKLTEKFDVSSLHLWSLTYEYGQGVRLYMDKMLVAQAEKIQWQNQSITGKVSVGDRADGGDALTGAVVYSAFVDFGNSQAVNSEMTLDRFGDEAKSAINKSDNLASRVEILSHILRCDVVNADVVVAMADKMRTMWIPSTRWYMPPDVSLLETGYVDSVKIKYDAMSQRLPPGVTTNSATISVLAELPNGVAGVVAGLVVKKGSDRHYVFVYSKGDGTFSLGWENKAAFKTDNVVYDISVPHVYTMDFDSTMGMKLYIDGKLAVESVGSSGSLKFSDFKVSEVVSIGNDARSYFPLIGMKIYSAFSNFGSSGWVFDESSTGTALFEKFDFLADYHNVGMGIMRQMFATYRAYGNVGSSSLNGEALDMERSAELIELFGAGALTDDGVTFKIDGLNMAEGELNIKVSPEVTSGNTLSILGKKNLGDRWQRVKVNPTGDTVSITADDLADYRFFQIRAELGEKSLGYTINTEETIGDSENTHTTSHITSSTAGGQAVLLTFEFDGGEDGDYAADYYKLLSFALEGVKAGVTATLATNGIVATTAIVGAYGKVEFDNVPTLKNGVRLSLGISTATEDGGITTKNLDEMAGVVSYAWGDDEVEVIDGGVTNIMTMLASSPMLDSLGGGKNGGYRIPALAKATNGVVLAVYDCRYNSTADLPNAIDWAENWSGDNGTTWTKPRIAINVPNNGEQTVGKETDLTDPCILYDPTKNKFWIMGITGKGLSDGTRTMTNSDVVVYSRGIGVSDVWENRRSVLEEIFSAMHNAGETATTDTSIRGILQGPGHGIVQRRTVYDKDDKVLMPKGALIFPMQYFPVESNLWDSRTFAVYSTDSGETWKATKLTTSSIVAQENSIVELDDGSWYMIAKSSTDNYSRQCFRTTDYVNWESVGGIYPSTWAQGSVLRLGAGSDGKSRYVACFATKHGETVFKREFIKLHFGKDATADGGTIVWDRDLDFNLYPEETGGSFAYSSMCMLDDTTLGVLLEPHGHIYFRKVDVSKILK